MGVDETHEDLEDDAGTSLDRGRAKRGDEVLELVALFGEGGIAPFSSGEMATPCWRSRLMVSAIPQLAKSPVL
ncbi:hypothetical protein OHS81_35855 [Streptomyces sp. NBC_00400]|uniref:hypothetical protein n=1 Tax=Streptomyces sp. NBC_00400 TaxID=2975737 RepID=UPI002E1D8FB6